MPERQPIQYEPEIRYFFYFTDWIDVSADIELAGIYQHRTRINVPPSIHDRFMWSGFAIVCATTKSHSPPAATCRTSSWTKFHKFAITESSKWLSVYQVGKIGFFFSCFSRDSIFFVFAPSVWLLLAANLPFRCRPIPHIWWLAIRQRGCRRAPFMRIELALRVTTPLMG